MEFSRIRIVILTATILSGAFFAAHARAEMFVPKEGFVPTATTAVSIAEAVLAPIYGQAQIDAERPFHAHLDGEIWTVTGTLMSGKVGGVATIRINKENGAILSVIHGR